MVTVIDGSRFTHQGNVSPTVIAGLYHSNHVPILGDNGLSFSGTDTTCRTDQRINHRMSTRGKGEKRKVSSRRPRLPTSSTKLTNNASNITIRFGGTGATRGVCRTGLGHLRFRRGRNSLVTGSAIESSTFLTTGRLHDHLFDVTPETTPHYRNGATERVRHVVRSRVGFTLRTLRRSQFVGRRRWAS